MSEPVMEFRDPFL